jgi:hypothetical protein
MSMQFVAVDAATVEQEAKLPEAIVAADIVDLETGGQGLRVVTIYPFPTDESQVEKGKRRKIYGRATSIPVTLNDGKQVFQDPDGNQVYVSSQISAKQEQATAKIAPADDEKEVLDPDED